MNKPDKRWGLSAEEWKNLLEGARYIASIVAVVLLTALIVMFGARWFGF